MPIPPQTRHFIFISSLIIILGGWAYAGLLDNAFQTWDTQSFVLQNHYLTALSLENISWMFSFSTEFGGLWHPLSWLSLAIDHRVYGGFNPWGFHLSNLIWHLLNSILLFYLVWRFLQLANTETWLAFSSAALAAVWFAIHPQHVESVAWVIERKDLLSLFFALLSLIAYLAYIDPHSQRPKLAYALSLLCFVCALLSKPMMVSLPVVLLLFDVYPRQQLNTQFKRVVWEKLPFVLFSGLLVILTLSMQQQVGAVSSLHNLPLDMRLINALNNVFFYLSKTLLPLALSPLYSFSKYQDFNQLTQIWLPLLGLLAITALTVWQWSRRPYLLIAWLFYLVTLLPVIGLIQVGHQAAADRYSYLPTIPVYVLLAVLIGRLWQLNTGITALKGILCLAVILITLGLGQLTRDQTEVWQDDLSLWQYTTAYDPDEPFAHYNLAVTYFNRQQYQQAQAHFQISAQLQGDGDSYFHLALIKHYIQKDLDTARYYYQLILDKNLSLSIPKAEFQRHIDALPRENP